MTLPLWAGIGMLATVMILIGAIVWVVDGLRAALITLGGTIVLLATVAGIVGFWVWIGGVYG